MNDYAAVRAEMEAADDFATDIMQMHSDRDAEADMLMTIAFLIARRYPAGGWMDALASYVSVARTMK